MAFVFSLFANILNRSNHILGDSTIEFNG